MSITDYFVQLFKRCYLIPIYFMLISPPKTSCNYPSHRRIKLEMAMVLCNIIQQEKLLKTCNAIGLLHKLCTFYQFYSVHFHLPFELSMKTNTYLNISTYLRLTHLLPDLIKYSSRITMLKCFKQSYIKQHEVWDFQQFMS